MSDRDTPFWVVISAGIMEILWLYAWAQFILFSAFGVNVTFSYMLVLYAVGAIVQRLLAGRSWIRLWVYLLHFLSFSIATVTLSTELLLKPNGKSALLTYSAITEGRLDIVEWLLVSVLSLISLIIWKRAGYYVTKQLTFERIYLCFDGATAAFLVLLITKLLAKARFETALDQPPLVALFLPAILMGMLTIGIKLSLSAHDRRFASRFQKLGITLGFGIIALIVGMSIVSVFNSQLTSAATVVSGVLKKGGSLLESILIGFLSLMKGGKRSAAGAAGSTDYDMPDVTEVREFSPFVEEILKWLTIGIGVILASIVMIVLIRLILKYLLARGRTSTPEKFDFLAFFRWLISKFKMILNAAGKIKSTPNQSATAKDLYQKLLAWGQRSGLKKRQWETPKEFQIKISRRFPEIAAQATQVIDLVYEEAYRQVPLHQSHLVSGKIALRKMRTPRLWPRRIKTWLFTSDIP